MRHRHTQGLFDSQMIPFYPIKPNKISTPTATVSKLIKREIIKVLPYTYIQRYTHYHIKY